MCSTSMKLVFVVIIIRHQLCMIHAFFDFFVQNSFLTGNYILVVDINLTTRGLLYTCLFLHGCRGQCGTLFEPDIFSEKILNHKS